MIDIRQCNECQYGPMCYIAKDIREKHVPKYIISCSEKFSQEKLARMSKTLEIFMKKGEASGLILEEGFEVKPLLHNGEIEHNCPYFMDMSKYIKKCIENSGARLSRESLENG